MIGSKPSMSRKNKEIIARELGTSSYDPLIEHSLRRLRPEILDEMINGAEDERLPTRISK
jgi:hypothetical protein